MLETLACRICLVQACNLRLKFKQLEVEKLVPELFDQHGEGNVFEGFQREGLHGGNPTHLLEPVN